MPDGQGVATTRRRLRTELRRLREAAGLHQTEVVKQLDWSISKLIRIENGSVGISVTDVRALAALYHAEPELVEELVRLARITRERQWWSSYRHVLAPSYREYIAYEADASEIYVAHPTLVPGLLQTEEYIRAVLTSTRLEPATPERLEAEFTVRRRRQREILYSGHPPRYHVILDESALRRHIGGAKVMQAQIEHLLSLAEDLVTIAVWPMSAGGHVAMQGAFTIMEFANEDEPGVLFLESALGNPIERDQDQVDKYRKAFEMMLQQCLVDAEARSLMSRIADELSR
ncbi:MAG: helix-turn-helix domain-containing protein [Micromonosporaceae bacterium]|nr:helix-turn-helix domain-containing protein [Micromonosporaceae bacterium]